ncbi:MAG: ATP-binding cassette domain-containing protein, partial [Holosporales bacterium]|nr:ATP-binding cassette domain-containing protein [Holosporales bacterium]
FCKGAIKALNNISCNIESNKITGFIGPDGSGKTTFLRLMAGILTPDHGEITINGLKIETSSQSSIQKLHEMISYMPQKFGLYEDLSIMENLSLYGRLHNLKEEESTQAFERVLEITKLSDFRNRLAGKLSGGMKQKLGLACSLLKKPKVLILDEPSVGVDPISRKDLINMVNSMLDDETTILWSTAYLDEAEELDHIILLNDGKIIFEGDLNKAKQRVENRVYIFENVLTEKRAFAANLLKKEEVIDSIIIGNNVKFIVDHKQNIHLPGSKAIPPTFEDACIDMLGGLTEKSSPIEQYMKKVNDDVDYEGAMIEALNLTKRFGTFKAVDNISFSVSKGKILGLLGPNGSGKSTTFRMLCGLLKQNSGTAKIAGIDISDMGSDAKLKIGYMAQKFSLYPMLSAKQNLDFFSGAYRLKGTERKDAVDNMIDVFHMQDLENVNASVLSLGYKQRLALACAIMHRPQVLFLDEPTSGVDPITRREFWMHINTMVRYGMSVVVTTHFMDEAENCDEIALIYKGKIRASGTPDYLKSLCEDSQQATLEQVFINIVRKADEK